MCCSGWSHFGTVKFAKVNVRKRANTRHNDIDRIGLILRCLESLSAGLGLSCRVPSNTNRTDGRMLPVRTGKNFAAAQHLSITNDLEGKI